MHFVSIITDGGIISSVDLYDGDELNQAIGDMELHFYGHSFDGETDDARIFFVPATVPATGQTGVEIYSFDPNNPAKARARAIERFSQLRP
ncbi:hypothetical protein [Paenibacillus sp. UNC496MF]|uniref:hypothetical protein n=1 Tax=Paenibacillus sp. UNC496MF TaxID=1502753 RepID=UPI000B80C47F|nr:hypothetical protein [Paenibacillus sp. UNC496MF]